MYQITHNSLFVFIFEFREKFPYMYVLRLPENLKSMQEKFKIPQR